MLLRATTRKKQDKKGLSVIIGYILLIAISIVMSVVVYNWLKTYVPKDVVACQDGTSVFIKELNYNCVEGSKKLEIILKNNGKFSVAGYYVRASDAPNQNIATIDLSSSVIENHEGENTFGSAVVFVLGENNLEPGESRALSFDMNSYSTLYKIELIPVRWQEAEGKKKLVSCNDAKIDGALICK